MRVPLVIAGLMLCACPKKDEPPRFDPNDRLLQKMKEEQERLRREPPRPAQEPDPLAEILTKPSKPENLGIPSGVAGDLGDVSLTLLEVQQSQTVGSDKVSLATTERFLKVTLEAIAKKKPVDLDLSGATLVNGDQTAKLARDAQRAARGSQMVTSIKTDPKELVLYFEAPDEMIGKGLKIILTTPESRVELPLQ